jgi:hypothetical protein
MSKEINKEGNQQDIEEFNLNSFSGFWEARLHLSLIEDQLAGSLPSRKWQVYSALPPCAPTN